MGIIPVWLFVRACVQLEVVGGTGERQLGSLSTVSFDARASVDLDRIETDPFSFTWTCEALNDETSE
jgi:hypothetical protein